MCVSRVTIRNMRAALVNSSTPSRRSQQSIAAYARSLSARTCRASTVARAAGPAWLSRPKPKFAGTVNSSTTTSATSQQHADGPGLAAVHQARQPGPVVLPGQVAAQRHHGLAGIGLPRTMLRAVAAIEAQPGTRVRQQPVFQTPLRVQNLPAGKAVLGGRERTDRRCRWSTACTSSGRRRPPPSGWRMSSISGSTAPGVLHARSPCTDSVPIPASGSRNRQTAPAACPIR